MSDFKCGVVAVVGKPNVGKSTLMNALVGEKIAIVSPKPQTTRNTMAGIYQDAGSQVVFYDTPGIHHPKNKLSSYMLQEIQEALDGSDAALFLLDAGDGIGEEERLAAEWLKRYHRPVWVVLNKTDLLPPARAAELGKNVRRELGSWPIHHIQALKGLGVKELLVEIKQCLPVQPPLFPDDQLTDQPVRQLSAELIREQCFLQLKQEIPYGIAVVIEEFKEDQAPVVITATLYVEKESHKGILIGAGGKQLKAIGSNARERIEALTGQKVYLQLWVKVARNWRKNEEMLKRLGYGPKS